MNELRKLIREVILKTIKSDCWGGSHPEEMYNHELTDDEAFKKKSVLVPDDIKNSIKVWSKKMGMTTKK